MTLCITLIYILFSRLLSLYNVKLCRRATTNINSQNYRCKYAKSNKLEVFLSSYHIFDSTRARYLSCIVLCLHVLQLVYRARIKALSWQGGLGAYRFARFRRYTTAVELRVGGKH